MPQRTHGSKLTGMAYVNRRDRAPTGIWSGCVVIGLLLARGHRPHPSDWFTDSWKPRPRPMANSWRRSKVMPRFRAASLPFATL